MGFADLEPHGCPLDAGATKTQRWNRHRGTESTEKGCLGKPQSHRGQREELSWGFQKSSVLSVPLWLTFLRGLRGRSASGYIVPAVPGMATGGTGMGPNSSVCGIRLKGAVRN